jgi:methionyl-tRNA synthetase
MTRPRRTAYHTTPIYYVNDVPHPGHAYSTVATDALTRARRLRGDDVFFLTGTDEHGQNIERIATERGKPVQVYCDEIAAVFRALWERLEIRYDRFIRTTDDLHKQGVLRFWKALREAKAPGGEPAIYLGTYAGWYCPRCEGFKTDAELRQPDNLCADHERPCEWTEEENFFFRLSAYGDWLRERIESGSLQIDPAGRRNEVLAVIRQGLQDFSISRARVKWGIRVPEQPDHVFYVWMDALANYITALGFAEAEQTYQHYWTGGEERLHLIGKEIIRFHCLYWPAMLEAAGLAVPTRIFAHGHMTKGGKKLSKTTGNTIDPGALLDRYGLDAVRYFFLREGIFGQDWDFTDEALENRFNSDLANDFGNLVSRALTMASRYCGGAVPARPSANPVGSGIEERLSVASTREQLLDGVLDRYDALDLSGALQELWSWIGELNQRIVAVQPWVLAKDASRREELDAFLYRLLDAIRTVALLVSPVMPRAERELRGMLGIAAGAPEPGELAWGKLEPGRSLGEIKALFPRIEKEAKEKKVAEETQKASAPESERIDIADLARVELRVARIESAERIPKSKKLVRLQVDLGSEKRQIVAGIAEAYEAEALPGKRIVVVANLKPAKLMGVESNGMLLAASIDGRPVLLTPEGEVPPGTIVR